MHRFCAVCIEKWLRLSKYATALSSLHCHEMHLQLLLTPLHVAAANAQLICMCFL